MQFWLIAIVLGLVSASTPQRCPEKCECSTPSVATCSSLPLTKFGVEVLKLQIVNPTQPLKLSADVFKNLQSVNQLVIENATITEIDETAFSPLKLTDLSIKNSILPEIPNDLFKTLKELKVIDFSNSKLTNINNINSETVQEINLSGCQIHDLPTTAFENSSRLSNLNLSNNFIEEINFDAIVFENVVNLDLSYNPLKSIKGEDTEVTTLLMKSCNLKDIKFVSNLVTVSHLDVSDNEITNSNDSLYSLSDLQTIDLSNNKIHSIADNIFAGNSRLGKVILDNNPLKTLPAFKTDNGVLRIDYFSCNNCDLEILDEYTFKYAPTIKTLLLGNNKIKTIPAKLFQYIPSLVKVDLTNNALAKIENGAFSVNSALKTVILSGNPLKEIDASLFKYNRVLKQLDVSGCQLNYLWVKESSVRIPSLTVLNAENNNIKVVTLGELIMTNNLQSLELGGNPLDCNNVFFDMKRWLTNNNVGALKVKESLSAKPATETIVETWMDTCPEEDIEYDYDSMAYGDTADKDGDKDLAVEIDPGDVDDYSDATTFTYETEKQISNDEEFKEDAALTREFEQIGYRKHHSPRQVIVFLLPTLVFVLTALVVLILTVSIILCVVMNKKNNRSNAPQINIIPWRGQKVKKHSGSVYKPLSEEKFPV